MESDDLPIKYTPSSDLISALDTRFTYHPPHGDQLARYEWIRQQFHNLAWQLIHQIPPGREQSLMLTNLEQAQFWANSGIARGEAKSS